MSQILWIPFTTYIGQVGFAGLLLKGVKSKSKIEKFLWKEHTLLKEEHNGLQLSSGYSPLLNRRHVSTIRQDLIFP